MLVILCRASCQSRATEEWAIGVSHGSQGFKRWQNANRLFRNPQRCTLLLAGRGPVKQFKNVTFD